MKSSPITDKEQLPLVLNSKEASELLCINVKTLKDFLIDNPTCPHFRAGARGQYRFPRDQFLDWLDRLAAPKVATA